MDPNYIHKVSTEIKQVKSSTDVKYVHGIHPDKTAGNTEHLYHEYSNCPMPSTTPLTGYPVSPETLQLSHIIESLDYTHVRVGCLITARNRP